MTNSSIPAESLGSPSPVSASYLWDAPNKAVSIQISLDVIDRMEREVIDSFKAVTKRGSEVGGVLLGRIAQAGKKTVFVENYEPVACDYSRGPLYLLADPDKERLKEVLQRLKSSPLAAVGFFRGNTRKELVLDDEDVALAQEFFSDPNQVFLLVKPFAMKPSTAGFFYWENGQLQTESPLQFPFRRSELQKMHPQSIVQAGARPADAGASAPAREERAPVVFPKREERPVVAVPAFGKREEPRPGPVVVPPKREEPIASAAPAREEEVPVKPVAPPPIVSKREEPVPGKAAAPPVVARREEPAPVKAPVPPLLPRREDRPAAPPLSFKREERPVVAPPAKREERPAPPPPITPVKREERPPITPVGLKREEKPAPPAKQEEAPKREERPPVQPAAKREEAAPVAPAPSSVEKKEEPAAAAPAPPKTTSGFVFSAEAAENAVAAQDEPVKRGVGRWIAIAIVVLLIAAAGVYFFVLRGRPAATQTADAALNLRVERNAGQLVLTWNRNAQVIAGARKSTLSITDGDHTEDVDLDLGTLRSGSIVYSPITNDVGFRLEVSGAEGTDPVGESVRALAGRPSPLMQQAPPKAAAPPEAKPLPAASQTVPAQTQQPASSQPQQQTPASQTAASTTYTATPAAESAKPIAPVTVAPPKPDSLAARLRAAEPQELLPPPQIESRGSAAIPAPTQTAAATPPPPAAPKPEMPKPAAQTPVQTAAQTPAQTPAQPAPQQAQPGVRPAQQPDVRIGGNVEEAVVLRRVQPVYPPLARQARVSGIVRVEATIGSDGRVKKATAVSGPPLLRQAAVEAVQRWQYKPGRLNGDPVEVVTQVDVSFTLNR